MIRKLAVPLIVVSAVLGGCANNMGSNVYSSAQAQQVQTVREGTVIALAPVMIKDDENAVGTLAGGVAGGIAGSAIGGGRGSDLAAVGGAVLGGILGNMAEQNITKKQGVNITIRLKDGELISVVQEVEPNVLFQIGEQVLVYSQPGSSRVVPF
ncbi:glycine zipper 2TM domain-containing protein [Parendozoicomonas haliclonae]|uniref:Outer membrane lipoprotein SlyB n=1 Tax=Parendozoicomonas haliclonae TaxID=1960125 RepID=A0A1X7AF66_9GAMM|nr:glycine zipper 2TM domain-containing protein [Parendozoicomonas haliclonae]SMA36458.1 Outer membrane lipoprotein SlyB precursor [Parendozoicomonas haliclonae]